MVMTVFILMHMPMVVRMSMRMSMRVSWGVRPFIGAAFRLKGALLLVHQKMHAVEHLRQHGVGLDLQVVGLEFNLDMPVPQVIGGP